jgi:predicted small lipoprotein YifL
MTVVYLGEMGGGMKRTAVVSILFALAACGESDPVQVPDSAAEPESIYNEGWWCRCEAICTTTPPTYDRIHGAPDQHICDTELSQAEAEEAALPECQRHGIEWSCRGSLEVFDRCECFCLLGPSPECTP